MFFFYSARILRGLRIAARLGLSFSKDIETAIHKQAFSLLNLSTVLFKIFIRSTDYISLYSNGCLYKINLIVSASYKLVYSVQDNDGDRLYAVIRGCRIFTPFTSQISHSRDVATISGYSLTVYMHYSSKRI